MSEIKKESILKPIAVLVVLAFVASLLLTVLNIFTKVTLNTDVMDELALKYWNEKTNNAEYKSVDISSLSASDKGDVIAVFRATSGDNKDTLAFIGYNAGAPAAKGYIKVIVIIDSTDTITGVNMYDFSQTSGYAYGPEEQAKFIGHKAEKFVIYGEGKGIEGITSASCKTLKGIATIINDSSNLIATQKAFLLGGSKVDFNDTIDADSLAKLKAMFAGYTDEEFTKANPAFMTGGTENIKDVYYTADRYVVLNAQSTGMDKMNIAVAINYASSEIHSVKVWASSESNHAYVNSWLVDSTFANIIGYNVSEGEIVLSQLDGYTGATNGEVDHGEDPDDEALTVTPKAVLEAVNSAIKCFNANKAALDTIMPASWKDTSTEAAASLDAMYNGVIFTKLNPYMYGGEGVTGIYNYGNIVIYEVTTEGYGGKLVFGVAFDLTNNKIVKLKIWEHHQSDASSGHDFAPVSEWTNEGANGVFKNIIGNVFSAPIVIGNLNASSGPTESGGDLERTPDSYLENINNAIAAYNANKEALGNRR